jgi:PAS domain S-box-containing protein
VARAILDTGRASVPDTILYAAVTERTKPVAVLMLERDAPFTKSDLRALRRLIPVLDDRLDMLAEARIREVLARIDHQISSELRVVDLLYHILDGFETLLRYDHSAAILLYDEEHGRLLVRAERIVWQKMKSPHMQEAIDVPAEALATFRRDGMAYVIDTHAGRVKSTTLALREDVEVPAGDPQPGLTDLYPKLCYASRSSGPPENAMLVVPLLFAGRLLGILKVSALYARAFLAPDALVVGRFVERMSTAIRNARHYGRRLDELRAINEIGRLVTQQMRLEETCGRILDIVLDVMNLEVGSIELLDRDRGKLRVLAQRGYTHHDGLELGHGITGEVARTGKHIVANDVRHDPRFARVADTRSELVVPILFESTCLGVLNVESYTLDRFRERDVEFLAILADRTATALETLEQSGHQRATLELLYELSAKLALPEDPQPLLQLTVDMTRTHLSCQVASIFLFEDGLFRRRATSGLPGAWFPDESFRSGEGLTGQAAALKPGAVPRPLVVNDVEGSGQAVSANLDRYRERIGPIAHLIAVPLVEGDRPIGILRILNRLTRDGVTLPSGFSRSDVMLVSTIASQVAIALANLRKRQRIQQLGRKLEAQVRERTEEVHRLASFVENAPLAIFWIAPNGTLQFINDAGEHMFGFQADELRGRPVDASGSGILTDLADLEKVVDFMRNWSGEMECRRSDGSAFPAFISARKLAAASGDGQGIVVFARDATQTKELEQQLVEAEGKRAMADLAGGVAHDLNNALGSCLPLIQALIDDAEQDRVQSDQLLADLRQIENYTRVSVRIFKGMLQMARGTYAIDQSVSLNETLTTAVDLLAFKLQRAAVSVVRDLDENLPPLLAHAGRLEQAFHNLISNAIDAMPEGGTLTLRTYREGDDLIALVQDTGVGIPRSMLDRVQEPFYTSKRHGTGLGLSVVRSIVWEHNGKLTLESEEGAGTTVRLQFPRTHNAARDEEHT